jgi:hypothetical protein
MLRGVGFIRRLSNLRRVNATREPLVRLPFRPPAAHVVQLEPLPWNVAFCAGFWTLRQEKFREGG